MRKNSKFLITQGGVLVCLSLAILGLTSCESSESSSSSGSSVSAASCSPKTVDATPDSTNDSMYSNDPLYPEQWHLKNTGQGAFSECPGITGNDLNMAATWIAGGKGSGIIVAVVDSGLEIAHADLSANVVSGSRDLLNDDDDPTNPDSDGDHGTGVAGLIAARDSNSIGGRGVAPRASLKGFNYLKAQNVTGSFQDAHGGASFSQDVDIFNMSFGLEVNYDSKISAVERDRFKDGVENLRSSKGALYVKAAGNGYESFGSADCGKANSIGVTCQNANMNPYNTLPYLTVVGALNANGVKSSYSTAGSNLWISALGGEYGYHTGSGVSASGLSESVFQPAMVTTDQSGCSKGYSKSDSYQNALANNSNGKNGNCDYTSNFNGTSAATPVISGVIALILEKNPDLTWRDVKYILAKTAFQADSTIDAKTMTVNGAEYVVEPAWVTNQANYKFHNYYGFGRANVDAAIALAGSYDSPFTGKAFSQQDLTNGTDASIPDKSTIGGSSSITADTGNNLVIEAIQISVDIAHDEVGDLAIELTSGAGTSSVLLNAGGGFRGTADLDMVLATNAFYGEESAAIGKNTWTLKVVDLVSGASGTLRSWSLHIYGHTK